MAFLISNRVMHFILQQTTSNHGLKVLHLTLQLKLKRNIIKEIVD